MGFYTSFVVNSLTDARFSKVDVSIIFSQVRVRFFKWLGLHYEVNV